MSDSVYIESTIPSYYVAKPSRDIIAAARQQLTQVWWEQHREQYGLYISQLVIEECSRGDPSMSAKRKELISTLPILRLKDETIALAQQFLQKGVFPEKAASNRESIGICASVNSHP